jgi:UDP-N-acetylmuramoylalanine--D-glutamate ligase
MEVLVVGLAATGLSVVEYTRAAGHEVTVIEDTPGAAFAERAHAVRSLGAEVVEQPSTESAATLGRSSDLVVPSPGVHPDHPAIVAADAAGIPVRSEIDLAAARLRARSDAPKLIAVTGTNGKTTVTTLVDLVLREAGLRSAAAGNIGRPLIEAAGDDIDVVVAEVSSFQLAFTSSVFAPDVAVLLNVAEDHLDWHGSIDAYAAAKARIFEHQGAHALAVVNADDPVAERIAAGAAGRVARYSAGEPPTDGYGVRGEMLVGPDGPFAPAPASHAPHDRGNALAAAIAAMGAGASADAVATALARFGGLPHRVQLVRELDGVRFYDDSKATNPHATAGALRGFDSVVLIAGGRNKALDLGVLREFASHLRAVVAIGDATDEVAAAFEGAAPVTRAGSMHDAVMVAARVAQPGDAVLLSPACASFDWYDNYGARGDDFAREVHALTEVSA